MIHMHARRAPLRWLCFVKRAGAWRETDLRLICKKTAEAQPALFGFGLRGTRVATNGSVGAAAPALALRPGAPSPAESERWRS